MDGPNDCHVEWSKSDTERQVSYNIAYMWTLKQVQMINLTYKTEIGSQMQKTNLWLLGDKCKG